MTNRQSGIYSKISFWHGKFPIAKNVRVQILVRLKCLHLLRAHSQGIRVLDGQGPRNEALDFNLNYVMKKSTAQAYQAKESNKTHHEAILIVLANPEAHESQRHR